MPPSFFKDATLSGLSSDEPSPNRIRMAPVLSCGVVGAASDTVGGAVAAASFGGGTSGIVATEGGPVGKVGCGAGDMVDKLDTEGAALPRAAVAAPDGAVGLGAGAARRGAAYGGIGPARSGRACSACRSTVT